MRCFGPKWPSGIRSAANAQEQTVRPPPLTHPLAISLDKFRTKSRSGYTRGGEREKRSGGGGGTRPATDPSAMLREGKLDG